MILTVLGIFTAIYTFARKVVINDPLKGQIDLILASTNKILSIYKNKKPQQLFDSLLIISDKGIKYSLLLSFLIFLLPNILKNYLLLFIGPILFLCAALNLSISIICKHNKTFKELFVNFQMITILFSPTIFYLLELYLKTDEILINIFYPFYTIVKVLGIINFQILWLLAVVLMFYFGIILIALPTYLTIYTLIFTTAFFIKIVEKHISQHIMDGIVGIVIVLTACLKLFIL